MPSRVGIVIQIPILPIGWLDDLQGDEILLLVEAGLGWVVSKRQISVGQLVLFLCAVRVSDRRHQVNVFVRYIDGSCDQVCFLKPEAALAGDA
jgi:hypothetical protein